MSDNVIVSIITGFFSLCGIAIGGFISIRLSRVEKKIDGRLSELLEITKTASKAEGNLKGRSESQLENNSKT